jgi:putative phage-type endonuclease
MKEEQYDSEAEWLAARQSGIGGSDAAAVLGLSPFETPLSVYARKRGLVPDTEETPAMRFGKLLEPIIAAEYVRETGRTLRDPGRYTIARSEDVPYLFATLDREILTADGKTVPSVLEIKSTNAFRSDDWLDEAPPHVQVQGQHQLLVTGRAWVSFAVLIGGQDFRWVDLERNDKFIGVMRERLAEFWRRVELGDPPPAVAEDKEVLAALYPREKPETRIALPPAAGTWDAARRVALDEINKWMQIKEDAEAKIKAAIGEAEAGLLPDGGRYTWKTVAREAYEAAATSYRQLRRLKK